MVQAGQQSPECDCLSYFWPSGPRGPACTATCGCPLRHEISMSTRLKQSQDGWPLHARIHRTTTRDATMRDLTKWRVLYQLSSKLFGSPGHLISGRPETDETIPVRDLNCCSSVPLQATVDAGTASIPWTSKRPDLCFPSLLVNISCSPSTTPLPSTSTLPINRPGQSPSHSALRAQHIPQKTACLLSVLRA